MKNLQIEIFLPRNTSNTLGNNKENPLERIMNRISSYVIAHSPCEYVTPVVQLRDSNNKVSSTLKKLEEFSTKLHRSYVPQPFQGVITIFRAMESPPGIKIAPEYGWGKIAKAGVEIHQIPGNYTFIMESPLLAEKMRDCIKRAIDERAAYT
ncbi:MAG: hypothetical protein JO235_03380 [Chroococcidiopsidaceae cyanobacterium CP_BM_RX_35]|nr:hypothetical protein [Chroococcidiopsidaceae cyanobacterium CP_BM_RX_35]